MQVFDHWLLKMIDFPALVLILVFALGAYVIYQTHRADNGFDFSDMLRDTEGKASSARLAMFVCLGISSWGVMYMIVHTGTIDSLLFLGYTAIWSGQKVAEKAIDAYQAKITASLSAPAAIP